ncbi:MAG: hypothetical protein K5765_06230 [Clostridia bacterium]|nr:hypothetical protein [Clostridia bacterium]
MSKTKKVLLGIFIPIIVLILVAVIIASILLIPSSFKIEEPVLTNAYGTVLADIDGITTANPRYIDIACLGSHDSFSSLLKADNPADETAKPVLKTMLPIIKNFTVRYAVTQYNGIYEQLMNGTRFLHIKVTLYNNEWYTSHSVLSGKLETHILEILKYLTSANANGEIVGILFQPITLGEYSFNDLHTAIDNIKYEGKSLFDYVNYTSVNKFNDGNSGTKINELRYNDITNNGTKPGVVLFDRRSSDYLESWDAGADQYPYFFDMDKNAIHIWNESSNTDILMEKITNNIKLINDNEKYIDFLRMNQTQAAFVSKGIKNLISSLTAPSLLNIAQNYNLKLIERTDFKEMLAAMPIFQVDFVTSSYGNFNFKANKLIREYNEELVSSILA